MNVYKLVHKGYDIHSTKMKWKIISILSSILLYTNGDRNVASGFVCMEGTRIALRQLCDGIKHCPDGSDETQKLCFHIICPATMFRCYYGACISKKARCDEQFQCADNSDESQCGINRGSCEVGEFQCASRECISTEKLCDGVFDCEDKSDESPIMCEEFACPENTYRCKRGGCIHLDARCNGFRDCVDGSDESDVLCKSLNCVEDECSKVQENIFCPPINSTRITVRCKSKMKQKGWLPCNEPLPVGTIAQYECKPYFLPSNRQHVNNTQAECQLDGTWNREHLKCEPECGTAAPIVTPLIVHGWIAGQGMWPWHGSLYNLRNGIWSFWCGSSLISEKVVLTAAHCVWKITADTLRVALGKSNRGYNDTDDFTQILDVQEIITQPLYQDVLGNYGSDIAILILGETVLFSPFVQPVCVDWQLHDITEHLAGNNLGMVVGMGITENDTFSNRLRASFLPAVSDDKCIDSQKRDFRKYVTYTSFCAGWRNGSGVCNGDSGGGLVFPKASNRNKWVLQGIVSVSPRRLGTSFCDPQYYTIFTKVGMYVDWIQHVLNEVHPERDLVSSEIPTNVVL